MWLLCSLVLVFLVLEWHAKRFLVDIYIYHWFIVPVNYSMRMHVTGKADFIAQYLKSCNLYRMIVSLIKTMSYAPVIMLIARVAVSFMKDAKAT